MWKVILYQPLFNLLIGFYYLLGHNMGLAIIALTLLVRLALMPLTKKSLQAQKKMAALQPHLEKIKKDHGHDQKLMAQKTMELYQQHGINPTSSCLPLLIQFPIFIALYRVFYNLSSVTTSDLFYRFMPRPETINTHFLWFDLSRVDAYYVLPILVGVTFFWQSKMSMPAQNQRQPGQNQDKKQEMMQDFQAALSKQTLYVFPVMFTFIALKLPSALSLYWVISTAFGIIQQYLIMKEKKSINNQSNLSPLALEKGKSGKTQIAVKKRE